jgi:HlyD family secretion protein
MKYAPVLLVLVLCGCSIQSRDSLTVSGQIESVGVDLGSRVGGRVKEVLVDEGDHVETGAVLVRLEDDDAQAQVAAAKAQLANAEALVQKLKTGARPEELQQAEAVMRRAHEQYQMAVRGARNQEIEAARAAVEAARAQRNSAAEDLKRAEGLISKKAISQQALDKAKHALEATDAQLKASEERLDMTIEGARSEEIAMAKSAYDQAKAAYNLLNNGARAEDIQAAEAGRDAAAAALARAETNAREMVVTTPQAGTVESIDIHPGDLVKPGPIVRVVDPENLKLYVYVSEAELGRLKLGQKVLLTTDSHGDETFESTIIQIATEGEYTPRNLQTEEERVQQVFGIKLKLTSANGKLRPGMTATAHFGQAQGSAQ